MLPALFSSTLLIETTHSYLLMNRCIPLLIFLSLLPPIRANTFTGSYEADGIFGQVILSLEQQDDGTVSGTLNGNGLTFELAGIANDYYLEGEVLGQPMVFTATKHSGGVQLSLSELNVFGVPSPETTQVLDFFTIDGTETDEETTENLKDGAVVINEVTLSDSQIEALAKKYGVAPLPGNYWYDSISGLYGAAGYPAFGFMFPGHQFGTLKRTASNGNTQVIVNNRELPQSEWAVWSYMLGSWIEPGNYWLDSNGNAGYVGVATPLVNLYRAAIQNSYGGQGGSGDNFWSSRFSAGNSNTDNTQGYVSVPGHGPVGYGF